MNADVAWSLQRIGCASLVGIGLSGARWGGTFAGFVFAIVYTVALLILTRPPHIHVHVIREHP